MKKISVLLTTFGLMLLHSSLHAQIIAINPVNSAYAFTFQDSNSFNTSSASPGSLWTGGSGGWNGSTVTYAQTDTATFDSATTAISASVSGTNYAIGLNFMKLAQDPASVCIGGNNPFFNLQFIVEYQVGVSGYNLTTPLYPLLTASGTLQSASSTASLTGTLNFVDASSGTLLSTVNYTFGAASGPAIFSLAPVTATPGSGFSIAPGGALQVVGNFLLNVDPASLEIQPVPEPGSLALVAAGFTGIFFATQRRHRH